MFLPRTVIGARMTVGVHFTAYFCMLSTNENGHLLTSVVLCLLSLLRLQDEQYQCGLHTMGQPEENWRYGRRTDRLLSTERRE